MIKELSSHITGRNTMVYLESERSPLSLTLNQIISFLQEVSKQYSVVSLEDIELDWEKEFDNEEHFISCTILIPARKEDWDAQSKKKQEEKDRRLTQYLALKKEFEKE
jgi:hypothetical protein